MEKSDAVAALAALAQDNRLDVFRLLVQAGADGLPAGRVAAALDLAPNTLTFHFDRLRVAGLARISHTRCGLRRFKKPTGQEPRDARCGTSASAATHPVGFFNRP